MFYLVVFCQYVNTCHLNQHYQVISDNLLRVLRGYFDTSTSTLMWEFKLSSIDW